MSSREALDSKYALEFKKLATSHYGPRFLIKKILTDAWSFHEARQKRGERASALITQNLLFVFSEFHDSLVVPYFPTFSKISLVSKILMCLCSRSKPHGFRSIEHRGVQYTFEAFEQNNQEISNCRIPLINQNRTHRTSSKHEHKAFEEAWWEKHLAFWETFRKNLR